jgi:predicted ATPase
MSDQPYHQSLRLKNFTAFAAAEFEFVPGINVFVGENGTGKTHVMKALYAMQLTQSRQSSNIRTVLEDLFQTKNAADVIRKGNGNTATADVSGRYSGASWHYSGQRNIYAITSHVDHVEIPKPERPVFIPAIDMMGHTKGFTEAYDEVRLDFDLTCRDVVNLLRLERRNGNSQALFDKNLDEPLARLLNGKIERDDDGRFYLATEAGRLPMPMVAEGLRKIATLVQLERNGWLTAGTTLFWDEPEVNLNPILMGEVVSAILALTRRGIQVFLATHSYIILKEIDLQTRKEDTVRYFAFQGSKKGTIINATEDFALLMPNPILEQYDSLYDRELTRSTGRSRQGERVY